MADPFPEKKDVREAILDIIAAARQPGTPRETESVSGVDGTPIDCHRFDGKSYVEEKHYLALFQLWKELAGWKQSALTVRKWWEEVDAYVRKHPSGVVGDSVSAIALRLLKERDDFALQIARKDGEIAYLTQRVELLSSKLDTIRKAV
jgi:hypothetical protein